MRKVSRKEGFPKQVPKSHLTNKRMLMRITVQMVIIIKDLY